MTDEQLSSKYRCQNHIACNGGTDVGTGFKTTSLEIDSNVDFDIYKTILFRHRQRNCLTWAHSQFVSTVPAPPRPAPAPSDNLVLCLAAGTSPVRPSARTAASPSSAPRSRTPSSPCRPRASTSGYRRVATRESLPGIRLDSGLLAPSPPPPGRADVAGGASRTLVCQVVTLIS